jgi:hypothetical protein
MAGIILIYFYQMGEIQMKKKILVVALVVVMCLSITSVAFAVDSPVNPGAGEVVGPNGEVISAVIDPITDSAVKEKLLADNGLNASNISAADQLWVNIDIPAEFKGQKVTVTIDFPGVNVGDSILIRHFNDEGVLVETISATVTVKDKVTFVATGASPFAFFRIAKAGEDTATAAAATTSAAKSPKTGEMDMMVMWLVIALIATGVTLVSAKKAKATK